MIRRVQHNKMVNIRIRGLEPFPCPAGWKVGIAVNRIRSIYGLLGGGIFRDGEAIAAEDTIENDGANYEFVNFQTIPVVSTFVSAAPVLEVLLSAEELATLSCYKQIGAAMAVDQNEILNTIASTIREMDSQNSSDRPFIAIIAPSGSGKTQLPFALKETKYTDETVLHVVHVVFSSDQRIHEALAKISKSFLRAVEYDLSEAFYNAERLLSCSTILDYEKSLQASSSVKFLLGTMSHECTPCTANELTAFVSKWKKDNPLKIPVFFLDATNPSNANNDANLFRYSRNLLRAVGLVVVVMGTDRSITNCINVWGRSSRVDIWKAHQLPDWCTVITKLPPLTEETAALLGFQKAVQKLQNAQKRHETLCEYLRSYYSHCLPRFIQLLSVSIDEIPEKELLDSSTVTLFDRILQSMVAKLMEGKKGLGERDGLRGQFALHLNIYLAQNQNSRTKDLLQHVDRFVANHFAYLTGDDMIVKVKKNNSAELVIGLPNDEVMNWNPKCEFPNPTTNSLLYLMLGGGASMQEERFPDPFYLTNSKEEKVVFTARSALAHIVANTAEREEEEDLWYCNINAISRSGDNLEAIAVVAMDIASHGNGLAGMKLPDYILALAVELSLVKESSSAKLQLTWSTTGDGVSLEGGYDRFPVPYLSPPNDDWPDLLYNIEGTFLGNLERTANRRQLDIGVTIKNQPNTNRSDAYYLSGEAPYHQNNVEVVGIDVVMRCLQRVNSQVHFCIFNKLKDSYFKTKQSTWNKFIKSRREAADEMDYTKMNVLRLVVDQKSHSIQLKCMNGKLVSWSECQYLVIFIAVEDLQFDAATQQSLVGKRRVSFVDDESGSASSKTANALSLEATGAPEDWKEEEEQTVSPPAKRSLRSATAKATKEKRIS